ncbi:MAG: aminoglycoside phosphotransferase family protein [Acidobacteriia bacterium]|nr:aminoglycoside phosphotransferase family protein [Terriglobia bacterium]
MPDLSPKNVASYLGSVLGEPVTVHALTPLGGRAADVKGYGYGTPVRVDYESRGERRVAVLHTISPGPFGHEHMADRAAELLWEHRAFNRLPRHVRSLDSGGFMEDGRLIPLGKLDELCLLTEYAEGREYATDLQRICRDGCATPSDFARADALCDYLAGIHQIAKDDPQLYLRRARELVGGNECIFGLTDSYPSNAIDGLEQIEHLAVDWRWRLKRYTHRLRQVHGDFHPWNILFASDTEFTLLDRSRGEFGDPADDVTSLTLNYVFFSLQRSGRLEGAFENLFRRFWDRYLDRTGDREILEVALPFCAFRGLVMASPVWYPALAGSVRSALLRMIVAILKVEAFDPASVNQYCGV